MVIVVVVAVVALIAIIVAGSNFSARRASYDMPGRAVAEMGCRTVEEQIG
jgi:hypothetical protein